MKVSREELYRLVCEAPLREVATQFGISGSTLAALCKKHDVPYPGSGYWTRKAMGLPVELPVLRDHLGTSEPIDIEPSQHRQKATPQIEPDQKQEKTTMVHVSERLVKPHAIIAGWISNHEQKRREALSSRDPWLRRWAPDPFSEADRRRHRILDALFKALEKRGAKVTEAEKGLLRVTIDGEKIEFQIREKYKQVKLSPEEQRSSYRSQDLVGTGRLVFAIRTYLRGPHNEEWLETEKKPLESQLPEIVERLFDGARILKAWHLEQEIEREERRKAEALRAERQRLIKQEEKRREKLAQLAQDWRSAQLLRDFIDALRAQPYDPLTRVGEKTIPEWIEWADDAIRLLNPVSQGLEKLFAMIESVKVERSWGY